MLLFGFVSIEKSVFWPKSYPPKKRFRQNQIYFVIFTTKINPK